MSVAQSDSMPGDVSAAARMAGGVLLAPIAASGLLVLPIYVGGLIDHLGMTLQSALFIVSMDMWGMAAALLPAYFLMRRISWRLLGMTMLLAMVVCFAVPALVYAGAGEGAVTAIGVWRLLGGVCSGTLMAIVLSTLGKLPRADRAFSIWVLTQILFKVAAIYGLAIVLVQAGMQGFFLSLAALACLGLPLAWTLPHESCAEQRQGRVEWSGKAITSLTGLVAFYIALSGLWANFESIGKTHGFAVLDIAAVLSLTSLAGLAGATLSTLLAGRIPRLHALAAGIALIAMAGYGLSRFDSLTAYTVIGTAFAFAWFFTVPLLLATVNRNDRSGRLMVFANAAIAFGVAAGPSLSGVIVTLGSYSLLSTLGAAAFLLVFVLLFPSARED